MYAAGDVGSDTATGAAAEKTGREGRTSDELCGVAAVELAKRIARREVSSSEVVEAHIARIEETHGKLNAVVVRRFAEARAEAKEVDRRLAAGEALGPLAGVPVTIKECLDLAGAPSTFGIPARASHRAAADEEHVARLRAAGAIVIGKTNVAQALIYIESDNPLYGRTSNPWNLSRSPGGSSGGEAAVIAAGGSALGLGTDIGGSVRVPAAWSGLVGFKPTSGRADDPGRFSVGFGQRAIPSQVGSLGRTVEDVAEALWIVTASQIPFGTPTRPRSCSQPATRSSTHSVSDMPSLRAAASASALTAVECPSVHGDFKST